MIEGDYIKHHVCFSGTDYEKRTDVGMRTEVYPEYQKGTLILFIIFLWEKGPVSVRLFTKRNIEVLEEYMEDLSFHIPM